jgi:uncharacterized protein
MTHTGGTEDHAEPVALSDRVPVLSAEMFTIPLGMGRYALYAPLRRAAFVANAMVVNFIAALREGRYDAAADPDGSLTEFLRRLELVEAGAEFPPDERFDGDPRPTAVTLFLTTACNLRCTYCYASAGDTPVRHMPLAVARRGIDFVAANAVAKGADRFEVDYHGGGEPTTHWKVLTESFAYAKAKAQGLGLRFDSGAATNAVLSDEQINWIIANLGALTISFDGRPESHDKHRLNVLGQGSSGRVLHTLRRLDAAEYNYGLRITVTRDQIGSLAENVDFICANFRPRRVQAEPAFQLGRWIDAPSAETEEFIAAFREAQARAQRYGQEITFSAAQLDRLTNHFCSVSRDLFALSADGNVSACYEAFSESDSQVGTFFYGESDDAGDGYNFNLPVLNQLRSQTVDKRGYCQGCFAKWHCAGDCHYKSLKVNRAVFAGSDRCHITRELIKDQILGRIARCGGLFWHEPATVGLPPMGGWTISQETTP